MLFGGGREVQLPPPALAAAYHANGHAAAAAAPTSFATASPPPSKKPRLAQDRGGAYVPSPARRQLGLVCVPAMPLLAQGSDGSAAGGRASPSSLLHTGPGAGSAGSKSLLAGVVKPEAVRDLCKLLAIVTAEATHDFTSELLPTTLLPVSAEYTVPVSAAAQAKAPTRLTPGPASETAAAPVDSNAAVISEPASTAGPAAAPLELQAEEALDEEGGSSDGSGRAMSPGTLALMCDEATEEGALALPPSPGPSPLAASVAAAAAAAATASRPHALAAAGMRLFGEQERVVLDEFAACLRKVVQVGSRRAMQHAAEVAAEVHAGNVMPPFLPGDSMAAG
eukprot:SM000332S12438  [mRNA]  locus=s332:53840:55870:+ [translate_table: standard]